MGEDQMKNDKRNTYLHINTIYSAVPSSNVFPIPSVETSHIFNPKNNIAVKIENL